jgi:endonuclease/exonuclease/phosphatase family metal-dependent hydrolase
MQRKILIPLTLAVATMVVGAQDMKVMTRNIYIGATINPLLAAQSMEEVPPLVTQMWSAIQATDFSQRARVIATEIADANPQVVGLQEVALYRIQSPGDFLKGNPELATEVAVDFLALLLDELEARGASYHAVSTVIGTDVEMLDSSGDDIRLTDRDVVLVRSDMSVLGGEAGNYDINLTLPIGGEGGPPITLRRGWAAADVIADGATLRFVSTHLERGGAAAPVQMAQAAQLLEIAAASPHPVVLLGDFNSAADGSTTDTYGMMMQAGFRDAWTEAGEDEAAGYTCCHDDDLLNPTVSFNRRIDLILFGGRGSEVISSVETASVVGADSDNRTVSDLWPSDHAGVVSTLRVNGPSTAVASASWGEVKASGRRSE